VPHVNTRKKIICADFATLPIMPFENDGVVIRINLPNNLVAAHWHSTLIDHGCADSCPFANSLQIRTSVVVPPPAGPAALVAACIWPAAR
jgi:hypothetical protein